MCFGMKESGKKDTWSTNTETFSPNPTVQQAAVDNVNFVQGLQKQGFTPYGGQQVADFSPLQGQSFGIAKALGADNGIYSPEAKGYIDIYGRAPAARVNASTIASGMSPYMSAYVEQALAPQLRAQDLQFADQNRGFDAMATGAGAFGDTGWGVGRTNLTNNQNIARSGLLGDAYQRAFNTAIGASAQDQSNSLAAQTTNANLSETALGRALGANQALQGLGGYQANMGGVVNQFGQQMTAQDQAKLTAAYNQWMMAMQYPFQTAQLTNQTLGTAQQAAGYTKTGSSQGSVTESKPDNSGWGFLGTLAGSAANAAIPFMLSDARAKENIEPAGELYDGTKVYAYNYKGDPRPQIGVMAQEVEQRRPDAVVTLPSGLKLVDYRKATEGARGIARAFALAA